MFRRRRGASAEPRAGRRLSSATVSWAAEAAEAEAAEAAEAEAAEAEAVQAAPLLARGSCSAAFRQNQS